MLIREKMSKITNTLSKLSKHVPFPTGYLGTDHPSDGGLVSESARAQAQEDSRDEDRGQ